MSKVNRHDKYVNKWDTVKPRSERGFIGTNVYAVPKGTVTSVNGRD
jgi:hypothetical protein